MSAKKSCAICGKRAKRYCLSLDSTICSLCCGSKRGVEIDCSSECRFFPFAIPGYDLWLKLDGKIIPKLAGRVVEEVGQDYFKEVMESFTSRSRDEEAGLEYSFHSALYNFLLVEKDEDGRTLAERWETEDWKGLDRDEALMMRYFSKSFVTVIEIQKILDHQRMECVDLFDSGRRPFILLDRSLASRAVRFSRFFTWLTHYPHFSRPGIVGLEVPQIVRREFNDIILSQCRADTSRADEETVKEYMAANLADLYELLWELPQEKMRSALRNMDSHHCTAVYHLEADREEIEKILESKPDFQWRDQEPDEGDPPGTDYFAWHRTGESRALEKEMPEFYRHEPGSDQVGTVGNLKLTDDCLILETFTRQKYEFAKKMLIKYFRRKLKFQREKIVDLARQVAEKDIDEIRSAERGASASPMEEISPEIRAQVLKKFYRERYIRFLDEEIPALHGLTPRQAAVDPENRPLLLELMKEHLNGIEARNRDEGLDINIDSALRELGLEELINV